METEAPAAESPKSDDHGADAPKRWVKVSGGAESDSIKVLSCDFNEDRHKFAGEACLGNWQIA